MDVAQSLSFNLKKTLMLLIYNKITIMSHSIIHDYFAYYDKYARKYGKDKTLVLMQVGSFYEAYATNDEGPNLKQLEMLTDVVVTKRNTSKQTLDIKNPFLWGFPVVSSSKYIEILVSNGYYVVVIDQNTTADKSAVISRSVSAIYSNGTFIEREYNSKSPSNYLVGLFIEEINKKTSANNNPYLITIGMVGIDLSIGNVCLHESISSTTDEKIGLDEAYRFINCLSPNEIIIFCHPQMQISKSTIVDYLEINTIIHNFRDINVDFCKIPFQKKLLETIYHSHVNMTCIFDTLNITNTIFSRNALVSTLAYISESNGTLITNLDLPTIFTDNTYLINGNDALKQLDIIHSSNCLRDIINIASTNMGKRFINIRLAFPLTNPDTLQSIYSDVDNFITEYINICCVNTDFTVKTISNCDIYSSLRKIKDIEKLNRLIELNTIHPSQLTDFITSFSEIEYTLIPLINKYNISEKIKCKWNNLAKKISKLNEFLSSISIPSAKLYKINDIRDNIFKTGFCAELDELTSKICLNTTAIKQLAGKLDLLLREELSIANDGMLLTTKHNKRDGFYFQLTKKRANVLQKKLSAIDIIEINTSKIHTNDLVFTTLPSQVCKISAPFLKNQTEDIDDITTQITQIAKKHYVNFLDKINSKFSELIKQTVSLITYFDYITTIAHVSRAFGYIKPNIQSNDSSFVCIDNLRHPIVEQLISHEYVPHAINLAQNYSNGMLIYGLNSSGKSVLMKAVGIAVVMAQAGYYVSASKFDFCPFKAIYTRITGNDNIYRGLSSFSLEMIELNAILQRADKNTLVIGDEVCRGTEYISGTALVASSLIKLSDLGTKFIFATHLHDIMTLSEIQNRSNNIKAYHISVTANPIDGTLVYDRTLKDGCGEKIYGITVAKFIVKDQELINQAIKIKNELLKISEITTKHSKYNKKLIVDRCELCGTRTSPIETHHINKQSDCSDGFVKNKKHISKNSLQNLMAICNDCHDKIHNKTINATTRVMSSNGAIVI